MDPHAPCDLLLLGGTHVLVDESMRDISDGALAIDDGRIVAVGERAALEKAYRGTLDPCSHITYVMKAADVSTVIVGGRVIMDGRRLSTIDEEKAMSEVRRLARQTGHRKAADGG